MSFYLLSLLLMFALFGVASTYLLRFMYCYWFKKRLVLSYLGSAGLCVVLVVPLLLLNHFLAG
ncbi:hypothetical protein L1077_15925 [Pseudoalteromonas luteoviolacea]|uniref:Uncharacterized protein n=1 Tax=Pseudoalteromonas luteoviolacea H33 TaxID=1365251 RepID=A0A167CJ04_9GAMM|nr:hypothetical protein [Pseudoalteromonas luteoviolacea]KZN47718.1 hypothetical protein N476_23225 [Pseudoalteromonas luteoviolacea H33]KZN75753.1 hypothetical protein N477_17550 [Pseudoalteromonas luteoviolacea H33-S]MBQ4879172.1 hypothetical protein [Pseudoalteromonas luteoviolacea]MBQ4908232.1 hypothetical protein [Pseudoalteromonas luteoviolacea]MCF6440926.1 hypothetical protein [Pseudoalteromonas luteoviolacea]